jgi:DNA-binding MarR family transcriptional regulator
MVEDVVRSLGYLALGTRFRRLGERLQAHSQRIIDAHALAVPAAQFPFLAAIDRLGPLTVGELAEAVGVTQPGATRALAQLAAADLVAITRARDDQRCKAVTLTRQGRHAVATAKRKTWPTIEAAVRDVCGARSAPLLDQLAAIEDALDETPLERRAAVARRRRR